MSPSITWHSSSTTDRKRWMSASVRLRGNCRRIRAEKAAGMARIPRTTLTRSRCSVDIQLYVVAKSSTISRLDLVGFAITHCASTGGAISSRRRLTVIAVSADGVRRLEPVAEQRGGKALPPVTVESAHVPSVGLSSASLQCWARQRRPLHR